MRCSCGVVFEDREILREASRIRSFLRKAHRGGRPLKVAACQFCGVEQRGSRVLKAHEQMCPARPAPVLIPVSDADMAAMMLPDDAA